MRCGGVGATHSGEPFWDTHFTASSYAAFRASSYSQLSGRRPHRLGAVYYCAMLENPEGDGEFTLVIFFDLVAPGGIYKFQRPFDYEC